MSRAVHSCQVLKSNRASPTALSSPAIGLSCRMEELPKHVSLNADEHIESIALSHCTAPALGRTVLLEGFDDRASLRALLSDAGATFHAQALLST